MSQIQFGDRVEVLNGFYKDCTGIVLCHSMPKHFYEVEIKILDAIRQDRISIVTIIEENLKVIKKRGA